VGHYSGTSVESEGPFRNRYRNNFAKDLVRGVAPKGGGYIMGKEREEGEKARKNQPDGIWMPGS